MSSSVILLTNLFDSVGCVEGGMSTRLGLLGKADVSPPYNCHAEIF